MVLWLQNKLKLKLNVLPWFLFVKVNFRAIPALSINFNRLQVICMMRGHEIRWRTYALLHSSWKNGMLLKHSVKELRHYILPSYRYFWWSSYYAATKYFLCYQSCNWHEWSALSNASLQWKCGDSRLSIQARFVAKKQKTKCHPNLTRLLYWGNTSYKHCCGRTSTFLGFT